MYPQKYEVSVTAAPTKAPILTTDAVTGDVLDTVFLNVPSTKK